MKNEENKYRQRSAKQAKNPISQLARFVAATEIYVIADAELCGEGDLV